MKRVENLNLRLLPRYRNVMNVGTLINNLDLVVRLSSTLDGPLQEHLSNHQPTPPPPCPPDVRLMDVSLIFLTLQVWNPRYWNVTKVGLQLYMRAWPPPPCRIGNICLHRSYYMTGIVGEGGGVTNFLSII